jgi:hypothetical protein
MLSVNVKKNKLKLPKVRKKRQSVDIHFYRRTKVGTNYTYIVWENLENVLKG